MLPDLRGTRIPRVKAESKKRLQQVTWANAEQQQGVAAGSRHGRWEWQGKEGKKGLGPGDADLHAEVSKLT